MTTEMRRISAGVGRWTPAESLAEERGLPQAESCLVVPGFLALRARAFGPGAPGSHVSAADERFVTAEMRACALRSRPSERAGTATASGGVA